MNVTVVPTVTEAHRDRRSAQEGTRYPQKLWIVPEGWGWLAGVKKAAYPSV